MNFPEEEIQTNIISGNFQRVYQLAESWLRSIELEKQNGPNYENAREAYVYSRFFLHRSERISTLPSGSEKASVFLGFLREIEKVRRKEKFSGSGFIWRTISYYIHKQVADGFARDFAGQKTYNLNQEDILQLGHSLIEIDRSKSALECLNILYKMNTKNADVNFLLGFAYSKEGDEQNFNFHYREAMFLRPEVILKYLHLLPLGIYTNLWKHLVEEDREDEVTARYYALTLEINGVYKHYREMKNEEFRNLEDAFNKMLNEYEKNIVMQDQTKPRVLHYLTWLLYYCQQLREFEKLEAYKTIMSEIESEAYRTFQEKVLS